MKITKEKFLAYEGVRLSGATNMFAVNVVTKISGLTREECFNIMENYDKYNEQYKEEAIE